MIKEFYDYIIYGAGYKGITLAEKLSEMGADVLLLNRYGFPGGDITEALDLIAPAITDHPFLEKIKIYPSGFFYEDKDKIILNPEVVKILLLKRIIDSKLDTLFHIHPWKIESSPDSFGVSIAAREGNRIINSKILIDTSSESELLKPILPAGDKSFSLSLNLLINRKNMNGNIQLLKEYSPVSLTGNLLFLSTELKNRNNLNIDPEHEAIKIIRDKSLEHGFTIYLLPLKSKRFWKSESRPALSGKNIFQLTDTDFLSNDFNSHDRQIESFIGGLNGNV